MAIGTTAAGLTIVEMLLNAPLLLPTAAMPSLALTYAYRTAAHEADQRARSAVLLQLSQALAERADLVRRFLLLAREAFDADLAVVVLDDDVALTVDSATPDTVTTGPVPAHLSSLRHLQKPTFVSTGLPSGHPAAAGRASAHRWRQPRCGRPGRPQPPRGPPDYGRRGPFSRRWPARSRPPCAAPNTWTG
nr:hypothetical protein GCM10020092_032910 [Actinoplanes digitatis]